MEYAKKTTLGGYKVVQDTQDATHVVLTVAEHKKFIAQEKEAARQYQMLQMELSSSEVELKHEREACARELADKQKATAAALEKAYEEVDRWKSKYEYEVELNENLRRICRERANAERGLKPKKEHSGFVVLSSKQKVYKYRAGSKFRSATLWETVIETPYSVELTDEQAETEFGKLFTGAWEIACIGINATYRSGYEKLKADPEWDNKWSQYNVMVEQLPRANFRSGYWEMILTHTKPLSSVPKHMRPAK